jgi:4-hydroxybenzoate polyprenyltransferase
MIAHRRAAAGTGTIALRLEALWWLTRLYLNASPIWLSVLGWLGGGGEGGWPTLALLLLAVICAGSAHMVQNDILDIEPDRVTAPYLPLPAGLLTRTEATRAMMLMAVVAALALSAAASSPTVLLGCLALVAVSGLGTRIYSSHKSWGAADSLFVGLSMTVTATIGWLIGGHHHVVELAIIAPYALVYGFTANTWAALRDVDRDGLVGNRTLAVKIGGQRTVLVALSTSLVQYAIAAVLMIVANGSLLAAVLLPTALAIQALAAPGTYRKFGEPDLGRPQRLQDLRFIRLGETVRFMAVLAIYSPLAAVSLFVVLEASLTVGGKMYRRRIIAGGLARSMAASARVVQ